MQVSLRVSGGYGGLRLPAQVVDCETLGASERDELAALVRRAEAEGAAASVPSRVPDAMSFIVEVDDSGRRTILCGAEGRMPPGLAALVAWLERCGK
jgi:hypothetical protein